MEANGSNDELIKRIQKVCYGILCDVDDYCKANNIMYFLSGGTCLGAVRHQGFIPWDDDIDIMIPRYDYERLIKGFAICYKTKYKVGSLYTDRNWKIAACRIWDRSTKLRQKNSNEHEMGVFIDLFPIDGLPDNGFKRWLHYRRLKFLYHLRNNSIKESIPNNEKFRTIKKILRFLFIKEEKARYYATLMDKLARKYSFEDQKYVGAILATHYWDQETIPRECMESGIRVLFVDREFPIPKGYDQYLRSLYGDYMEIPKNTYTHLDDWEVEIED